LASRESHAIQRLLGQWVHRHGVNSLAALGQELAAAEPEAWHWWQSLQIQHPEPVLEEPLLESPEPEPEPAPVPAPAPAAPLTRLEPQLPKATRPAPAPSHPAVVQLRAWLPDQEARRAA
jgi:hypothetical protein